MMKLDNKEYFHALQVKPQKCVACMKCVRVCPTEALRVRNGSVQLDHSRCIDCGRCISACKYGALLPWSDPLGIIQEKKYNIAIISSSFAGQFSPNVNFRTAKNSLFQLGFDEVLEESMLADQYALMIAKYLKDHPDIRPVLSSKCPAVVRLIQVRFPALLPNLLHLESPMNMLAMFSRKKISREKNIPNDDISIFQIVPCISQVTAVHQPEGSIATQVNGAISIQEVFGKALEVLPQSMKDNNEVDIYTSGLSWAVSRMEANDLDKKNIRSLSVSGIPNVIEILLKIENHQIDKYDFIVLHSCTEGCVGGVLNVENPFVASSRIRHIINTEHNKVFHDHEIENMYNKGDFKVQPLEGRSIMKLSDNIRTALEKMKQIHKINAALPGLDCSACGSPTCLTLAEDIVDGKASLEDCVVLLRKKIKNNKK
jgi:iron only hydrogenase large subunit-like protein